MTVYILIDRSIEHDQRVLHERFLYEPEAIDFGLVSGKTKNRYLAIAGVLVFVIMICGLVAYGAALRRIQERRLLRVGHFFSGMKAAIKEVAKALQFVSLNASILRDAKLIHANDQRCGIAAFIVNLVYRVPYVYDCHEMVPFRARRTGLARMALEAAIERVLLKKAQRAFVVNRAIRSVYRRLYSCKHIEIRLNNFFRLREQVPDTKTRRAVVYVGANGPYRLIGKMKEFAQQQAASIETFFLDDTNGGQGNYETELVQRLAGAQAYMWCFFDTSILSYRYSLPNKFFQALALGVPIIVAEGTYLARLVRRYDIGVVMSQSMETNGSLWGSVPYSRRAKQVRRLFDLIQGGQVQL